MGLTGKRSQAVQGFPAWMGSFQLRQPTRERNTHPRGQEEPQSSRSGQELFFHAPADLSEDFFCAL